MTTDPAAYRKNEKLMFTSTQGQGAVNTEYVQCFLCEILCAPQVVHIVGTQTAKSQIRYSVGQHFPPRGECARARTVSSVSRIISKYNIMQ